MNDFYPPIKDRDTEELIFLSQASNDEWQRDAINQAKEELIKRGMTPDEIAMEHWKLVRKINKEIRELDREERKTGYKIFEKIYITIFWLKELFWDFSYVALNPTPRKGRDSYLCFP